MRKRFDSTDSSCKLNANEIGLRIYPFEDKEPRIVKDITFTWQVKEGENEENEKGIGNFK